MVVLVVYPPDRGSNLNLPEHSSATASFLGRLSNSLPALVAFTFARNRYVLYMQEHRYNENDGRTEFMINHNVNDLHSPGIRSPDSQSTLYPMSQPDGYSADVIYFYFSFSRPLKWTWQTRDPHIQEFNQQSGFKPT
jgi:hypothetical protein